MKNILMMYGLLLLFQTQFSQSQNIPLPSPDLCIQLIAPDLTVCAGMVLVPVIMNNGTGFAAFDLKLSYNNQVLTFTGTQGVHPALSGFFGANASGGNVNISFFAMNNISIPNGATLFNLKFTGVPGISQLNWQTGNCGFYDKWSNPLCSEYVNGNVIFSQGVSWPDPLPAQCITGTSYILSGGIPSGGTYSGPGVSGDIFNASLAGVGLKTLTYTYLNVSSGCSNSVTNTIEVAGNPDIFIVSSGGTICPGTQGVEICLSNTQQGVTYHMYRDGTQVGSQLWGSGEPDCFTPLMIPGNYTVEAVTNLGGCMAWMAGTASLQTDTEPPEINCPSAIVTSADPGLCGTVVSFPLPGVTDNCAGINLTQTGGLPSGSLFPPGQHLMSYLATDGSGNQAACDFTVTVTDDEPPVISCPADIQYGCDQTVTFSGALATDNCPGVSVVQSSGLSSGSVFPVGTTVVVFQADDAAGNTATCSITLEVSEMMTLSGIKTDVTCYGGDNGSAGVIPSGGTPPFNYLWNNGAMNQMISSLTAGIYQVTVTDSRGCSDNLNIVVSQPPEIIVSVAPSNVSCFGLHNGAAVLEVQGSPNILGRVVRGSFSDPLNCCISGACEPPFVCENLGSSCICIFHWTGTGVELPGLYPGTYAVTVTDSLTGCSDSLMFEITEPPELIVTLQPLGTLCHSDPPVTLLAEPEGGTFTGNGIMNGVFYPQVTGPGVWPLTYSYTDSYGCTGTANQDASVIYCPRNITGQLTYLNPDHTILGSVTVELWKDNVLIDTTITDDLGNYEFTDLTTGIYVIDVNINKPSGGWNAVDALLILKEYVIGGFLTGLPWLSGDVDGSTYLNSADGLLVIERYAEITNGFPAGDWVSDRPQVIVSETGTYTQDVHVLCTGDVNGSFTPH